MVTITTMTAKTMTAETAQQQQRNKHYLQINNKSNNSSKNYNNNVNTNKATLTTEITTTTTAAQHLHINYNDKATTPGTTGDMATITKAKNEFKILASAEKCCAVVML